MFASEELPVDTIVARLSGRIVDVTVRDLIAEAVADGEYVDTIMIDDDKNLVLAPDQLIQYVKPQL